MVVDDALEVVLVLSGAFERDVELGDVTLQVADLGLGAAYGVLCGQQLVAEIGVGLLGGPDELAEAVDLRTEHGRIVVGGIAWHRATVYRRPSDAESHRRAGPAS